MKTYIQQSCGRENQITFEVMESQETESQIRKAKSERYGKIAVILFLLLALFSALGAFIIWIFLGAASYFTFLFFYYRPREPKVTWKSKGSRDTSYTNPYEANATAQKKSQLIIRIVLASVVILFFFFFIIGIVSNADSDQQSSSGDEVQSEHAETLKDDPDNIDALTNVGNDFYEQENYDSALMYYDKVLKLDARNSDAIYNKGLVYYNKKEYQKSIEMLNSCLSVDASYRDAFYIMGHNYYDRQLYDDALNWYKRAYDAGLRDAFLSHALGYLYDNKQNRTQSLFHYKEALQQDSSRTDIYVRLAEMEPEKAAWYKQKENQWKN